VHAEGLLLVRSAMPSPAWLLKSFVGSKLDGLFWRRNYFVLTEESLCYWDSQEAYQAGHLASEGIPTASIAGASVHGDELHLYHWDAEGRLIIYRALSHPAALHWASRVHDVVAAHLKKSLPSRWNMTVSAFDELQSNPSTLHVQTCQLSSSCCSVFQNLVDWTFVCRATKDRRGAALPLRLEVVKVEQIKNISTWLRYSCQRDQIRRSTGTRDQLAPPVSTEELACDELASVLDELDPSVHECWVYHGTTHAAITGIARRGFRMDLAGSRRGTLYGKGIYGAECSSKADEYSEETSDGRCVMLLCRAALGRILIDKSVHPNGTALMQQCKSNHDSVCGDRRSAVGTYREFVFYDEALLYPAYIIEYRRIMEPEFCASLTGLLENSDPKLSQQIVPHAARLSETFPNPDVRYRLSLLLEARSSICVPVLVSSLADKRELVRRTAARGLSKLAAAEDGSTEGYQHPHKPRITAQAASALTSALSDSNQDVQEAAAVALGHLGLNAAAAVPMLLDLAGHRLGASDTSAGGAYKNVDALRVAAIHTLGILGAIGVAPTSKQALVGILDDVNSRVRLAAVNALAQAGASAAAAAPMLAANASDECPLLRAAAATALGRIGQASVNHGLPALISCLRDSDPTVRVAAAVALGQLGSHAGPSVSDLTVSTQDPCIKVKLAAVTALGRMGAAAVPAIPTLAKRGLADGAPSVRVATAKALLELVHGDHHTLHRDLLVKAVSTRLKDGETDVRRAAAECLRILCPRDHKESCKSEDRLQVGVRSKPSWRRTANELRLISAAYRDDSSRTTDQLKMSVLSERNLAGA